MPKIKSKPKKPEPQSLDNDWTMVDVVKSYENYGKGSYFYTGFIAEIRNEI